MSSPSRSPTPTISPLRTPGRAAEWAEALAEFNESVAWRSILQLSLNLAAYAALWVGALWSIGYSMWLFPVFIVLLTGFSTRLFIIQHDCGHGSYFRSQKVNDLIGCCLSMLTIIPYHFWKQTHAMHHATSGNLDKRGVGDVDVITLDEYLARSGWGRFTYRLYRNPVTLFLIGAQFYFLAKLRSPWGQPLPAKRAWRSICYTNLALLLGGAIMASLVGLGPFLAIQLSILCLSNSLGVWLFYVQHQYDGTYWSRNQNWDYFDASIWGSSYYALPAVLQWFTGNIGIHHVHHVCSRIPNYRLADCLKKIPELKEVNKLRFFESFRTAFLTLWDEDENQLIGFRQARAIRRRRLAA
jgi:omega-6 fatty acid desaturase (delta-12 desaturase)